MCVIKPDAGSFAPLAIGAVLIVMVYASGHNSGDYFNPAATIAVGLRGKCLGMNVPGYIAAQVVAGVAAAVAAISLELQRFGLKEKGTGWP